ncbi:hypothetical protein BD414DRAFT_477175 [Trametes punicea]|nr:hypothetical protein BD414DRAFT_477175 [Trametes punicea]
MFPRLTVLAALLTTHIAAAHASVVRDKRLPSITRTNNESVLRWGPCDPSVVTDPSITCSFLEVPLDYHDPEAGLARIAVAKANATGDRLGTLFINPGGPGGSGLQTLDQYSELALNFSGGRYDIVSWDPRGVGPLTTPGDVYCFDSVEEYNTFFNGTIELTGIEMTGNFTDPDDINALLSQAPIMQKKYEELGERCLQYPMGKYLKYMGTAATVRDMVALADAIDGPGAPVNYAGISYGSVIGSWFVNMFPERVGRVIVDGIINPTLLATEETSSFWLDQVADADKIYKAFVTGCALSGPSGCAVATEGQSAADVDDDIQTLIQEAHDAARRNSSVPVTPGYIHEQLFLAMYFPGNWAPAANTTYPEIAAAVTAEYHSQQRRGTMRRNLRKRQMNDTPSYSEAAIMCSDSVDRRGTTMLDIFETIISGSRTLSHLFTALWPNAFQGCPLWPVRAVERYQGPFNKTLANKVLVLSNTVSIRSRSCIVPDPLV